MSEWTLRSAEAKRLFVMGLAALALRKESGPGDPEKCAELATKFGAYSDFIWFVAGRSGAEDFKKILARLGKEEFIRAVQDAITYEDTFLPSLMEEAKRRGMLSEIQTISPIRSGPVRKFSFDD